MRTSSRLPDPSRLPVPRRATIRRAIGSLLGLAAGLLPGSPASAFVLDPAATPRFERLSIAQGLSNDLVNDVLQDRNGFLWIATADGLNRYDGQEIRVFRHDPNDPRSMAANWVAGIDEAPDGTLWVRFGIGGVDRFDPDRETFLHFPPGSDDPSGFPNAGVVTACADGAGRFWLGTAGGGCVEVVETEAGVRFRAAELSAPAASQREAPPSPALATGSPLQDAVGQPAPHRFVVDCLSDDHGRLWVGTAGGLFVLEPDRGERFRLLDPGAVSTLELSRAGWIWIGRPDGALDSIDLRGVAGRVAPQRRVAPREGPHGPPSFGPSGNAISGPAVVQVEEDPIGQIWIVHGDGRVRRYLPSVGETSDLRIPARVRAIRSDERGSLALATDRGFGILDAATGRVRIHGHDPRDPGSLGSESIVRLFEDRSGGLWLGTWGGGLQRWNERASQFRHHTVQDHADPPHAGRVLAIAGAGPGQVWVGTDDGLILHDLATGAEARPHPELAARIVTALAAGRENLWIATDLGLYRRGPGEHVETVFRLDTPGDAINALLEDRSGRLWVGTSQGLAVLSPTPLAGLGRVESVSLPGGLTLQRLPTADPPRPDALLATRVHALVEDGEGAIWVGTYIGGLSRLDPDTRTFRHFVQSADDAASLNNRSVNTLFVDSEERLWVGTYSGGLDLFVPTEGGFHHFTEREGLSGNQVNGILEDTHGRLWIATNQGLSSFDPASRTFRTYDVRDGLLAQPFTKNAGYRDGGGHLHFGGPGGFSRFQPDQIGGREGPPPVALTAFRILDRRVALADRRNREGELSVRPGEDFLSFEFVGIDFEAPERVRYAYRLDGFDGDWIECGPRRYAAYTNLDPGRYLFLVRAAGRDGVWGEPISIGLEVQPPFWRTAWFYALSAGLAGLLLFATHRYRVRQEVRRTLLVERIRVAERERIREQVSRDYHDEMGHTLSKLGIFSELIERQVRELAPGTLQERLRDYSQKVSEAAQSLVRDTRDFIWTLDPQKDSVYELALYLQEFGTRLFDDTGIRFHVAGIDAELRRARLSADWKRQLSLLFQEALTNSLRHSRAGEVEIRFGLVGERLEILARDDGHGFDPDAPGASPQGGNGLRNMRRRAETLGGTLEVETGPGLGTALRFVAQAH